MRELKGLDLYIAVLLGEPIEREEATERVSLPGSLSVDLWTRATVPTDHPNVDIGWPTLDKA